MAHEILNEPPPAPDPEDIETLAALEHTSWSGWAEYMQDKIEEELEQNIPHHLADAVGFLRELPCMKRWRRQQTLHYSELSESEQESDRNVARSKIPLYRKA